MQWQTPSGYKIIQLLSGRSNVFLLIANEMQILVDTSPKRKWKALNKRLKEHDVNKLDFLVLTHTHFDHAGNAAKIKENYKAKIVVHLSESAFLDNGCTPIPKGTMLFSKWIIKLALKPLSRFFTFPKCTADILVDDAYSFQNQGVNAYILHTPGHSKGSISLIVDNEIALVGDAMFGVFKNSVFPPFADDVGLLFLSWKKLIDTGCKIFLPSHGNVISAQRLIGESAKKVHN